MVLFLDSLFCLVDLYVHPFTVQEYLDYWSFIISLEIDNIAFQDFFLIDLTILVFINILEATCWFLLKNLTGIYLKLHSINGYVWGESLSSVQFSHSVVSNSLQPHGLLHARPPCPSATPGVYSNSCPLSQWCHPTISSSVAPFTSCLRSCPASGSFPTSQLFTSGGQSIEVSAWASVLPMNIQDWFPLRFTGWISLQSKGLSRVFSNTTVQKHQFFGAQLSL